jgi:hypothetical protein
MYAPANQVAASLAQIVKRTLARIGLDVEIKTFPALVSARVSRGCEIPNPELDLAAVCLKR